MFFALDPVLSKELLLVMSPNALAALKALLAGLILVVGMEAVHKIRELVELSKWSLLILVLVGLFGGALGHVLVYYGLKDTSVTNTTLLSRSYALLMALMGAVLLREKISLHQIVGGTAMTLGLIVIVFRGFTIGYTPYRGDILILGGALGWAIANILMKKYLQHIPPEVIVSFRNIVGGLVLLLVAAGDITTAHYTSKTMYWLIALALLAVVVPQLLWYKALELTTAANVGLTALSVPLFASAYAVILFGEKIVAYQLIGGALILLGLLMLEIHSYKNWLHQLEHRLKAHHLHH
jgi:drug/metabolite transporter (DMT)-like permease